MRFKQILSVNNHNTNCFAVLSSKYKVKISKYRSKYQPRKLLTWDYFSVQNNKTASIVIVFAMPGVQLEETYPTQCLSNINHKEIYVFQMQVDCGQNLLYPFSAHSVFYGILGKQNGLTK